MKAEKDRKAQLAQEKKAALEGEKARKKEGKRILWKADPSNPKKKR